MAYSPTPLENSFTPSELLMGRMLRTTLPMIPANDGHRELIKDQELAQRLRAKRNHDQRGHVQELPERAQQEPVHTRDLARQGTVMTQVTPRSYTVATKKGIRIDQHEVE